jgi:ferredoxin-NADP reductase
VFAAELRALTAHCHFILSRNTENTKPAETTGGHERGRIDRRILARLVPDVRDREVFVCGPQPMMKAVAAALGALQVRESMSGFSGDIVRIKARTSDATGGRPVCRRLFRVQNKRRP